MIWFGIFRRRLLADPKRLGRWGEKFCENFLKRKGLVTVARNYRCNTGEIDLIMADHDRSIVFIEVKTRADEKFAAAQDAVTFAKRRRIVKASKSFVSSYKLRDRPLRFDVAAVVLGRSGKPVIRHYESAFVP